MRLIANERIWKVSPVATLIKLYAIYSIQCLFRNHSIRCKHFCGSWKQNSLKHTNFVDTFYVAILFEIILHCSWRYKIKKPITYWIPCAQIVWFIKMWWCRNNFLYFTWLRPLFVITDLKNPMEFITLSNFIGRNFSVELNQPEPGASETCTLPISLHIHHGKIETPATAAYISRILNTAAKI